MSSRIRVLISYDDGEGNSITFDETRVGCDEDVSFAMGGVLAVAAYACAGGLVLGVAARMATYYDENQKDGKELHEEVEFMKAAAAVRAM